MLQIPSIVCLPLTATAKILYNNSCNMLMIIPPRYNNNSRVVANNKETYFRKFEFPERKVVTSPCKPIIALIKSYACGWLLLANSLTLLCSCTCSGRVGLRWVSEAYKIIFHLPNNGAGYINLLMSGKWSFRLGFVVRFKLWQQVYTANVRRLGWS